MMGSPPFTMADGLFSELTGEYIIIICIMLFWYVIKSSAKDDQCRV